MDQTRKLCTGICKTEWPLDRFKVISGRRQAMCVACWNDYQKRWLRERRARRTQEEHQAAITYQRQHYAANRERIIAKKQEYKKANPERNRRWNKLAKLRAAQRRWAAIESSGVAGESSGTMVVE